MSQAFAYLFKQKRKEKMLAMASETKIQCLATDWLEEDNLMLLECWARDGYTFEDIANRIGIGYNTLRQWRSKYPAINDALKKGREIIDYKVENALLKSALGYKTKEVKVTTTMRYGKVVETIKEVTDREQAPNVSAIQCWLYNRLPDKWKNMNSRSNILENVDEDTSIQVTVTRASKGNNGNEANTSNATTISENDNDIEWQDEVNSSIEIRKSTEEEREAAEKAKAKAKEQKDSDEATKIEVEAEDDPDFWPDDWEDENENEDWEE